MSYNPNNFEGSSPVVTEAVRAHFSKCAGGDLELSDYALSDLRKMLTKKAVGFLQS